MSGVVINVDGTDYNYNANPIVTVKYNDGPVTTTTEMDGTVVFTPDFDAYYLSPTGSDTNTGSYTSPFLTLNKASSVAAAGDKIILLDGDYTTADSISCVGTALLPITIKPLNYANVKILNSVAITGSYLNISLYMISLNGVTITDSDYLSFTNFIATVTDDVAITITNSNNCTFESTVIMGASTNTNDAIVLVSGDSNQFLHVCFSNWYGANYLSQQTATNTTLKFC